LSNQSNRRTFSNNTLSITIFSIARTNETQHAIMLNVDITTAIMLSAVSMSVAIKSTMLGITMLSVVMLRLAMLSVFMLSVIYVDSLYLECHMLSVINAECIN